MDGGDLGLGQVVQVIVDVSAGVKQCGDAKTVDIVHKLSERRQGDDRGALCAKTSAQHILSSASIDNTDASSRRQGPGASRVGRKSMACAFTASARSVSSEISSVFMTFIPPWCTARAMTGGNHEGWAATGQFGGFAPGLALQRVDIVRLYKLLVNGESFQGFFQYHGGLAVVLVIGKEAV